MEVPRDTQRHCHPLQAQLINSGNTQITRLREGSIATKGRVKEWDRSQFTTLKQQDKGFVLQVLCPGCPASALPSLASWKVTSIPNGRRTSFLSHSAPKHYQHPTSCWDTKGIQRLLQGGEGRWGSHCLPAHFFTGYPKKQEGVVWATHDIRKLCSEQSRHLCAHSHHPSKKEVSMKLQLWKLTQTALNFNSQPSQAQSPLITTRPMNVRCLEWKQRVKIPVWIFSWKSVIENHLSVRQN